MPEARRWLWMTCFDPIPGDAAVLAAFPALPAEVQQEAKRAYRRFRANPPTQVCISRKSKGTTTSIRLASAWATVPWQSSRANESSGTGSAVTASMIGCSDCTLIGAATRTG
jgi:hypothetical protein